MIPVKHAPALSHTPDQNISPSQPTSSPIPGALTIEVWCFAAIIVTSIHAELLSHTEKNKPKSIESEILLTAGVTWLKL